MFNFMFICLFFLFSEEAILNLGTRTVTLIQGILLNKSILQPKGGGGIALTNINQRLLFILPIVG